MEADDFWIKDRVRTKQIDAFTMNRTVFIESLDDKWTLPVSKKEKGKTNPCSVHVGFYSPTARPLMHTSWAAVGNTQHDLHLFHLSTKIPHRLRN